MSLTGNYEKKKKKNTSIRKKNWGTEHSKGDRIVPAKMATICT
jgi:hypothetical protein